jgi:hypothetical protein
LRAARRVLRAFHCWRRRLFIRLCLLLERAIVLLQVAAGIGLPRV